VSGAAESLLGFRTSDLVGQPYTTIVFEEDTNRAQYRFNERRTGKRSTSGVELRLKRFHDHPGHNGNGCLTVELKAMGIYDKPVSEPEKTFQGTYGIARDITDRKRLETHLLHAQKMEAIGTLAGGIAHDFNNLLMGIEGRASLMFLNMDADHPHHEHLKGVEEMVQRGAHLTKQLLGFARGGKYEVQPTNLNKLVEKSSAMFGRTKKEIRIDTSFQKEVWTVEVDRAQIDQVLLNLFLNAWQAMPDGGDLYIQVGNVTLDETTVQPFGVPAGRFVKVSVTDTGLGMDDTTQQRIFEPFFTTRPIGQGTGLGLASAYGIVKNHGGIIDVHSRKGAGTTFNVFLPATETPVKEEGAEAKKDEIQQGQETILLVDDEEIIIDVGKDMLTAIGYKVLLARSGKEAIDAYRENSDKIDMVILDMIMPDMGGGSVYDMLKEINPDIKVLLSSGYSIEGQATEILDRGCDGFIQKPFSVSQLSKGIRKILDN